MVQNISVQAWNSLILNQVLQQMCPNAYQLGNGQYLWLWQKLQGYYSQPI